MDEETTSKTGGLSPEYKTYERQKCFVAHSHGARWCDDVVNMCNQVLPEFGLEPWYAADHFDPTKPLRDKVVELIANTRYGIYDLSYWRKDDKSEWHMPRNVLIELGVAIALNRPTLLLRHVENRISELQLPTCLESVSANILEFSGGKTLQLILKEHLSRWAHTPPEHDWWNRYCMFGNRICEYREAYPHGQQWGQETIRCHISDGQDTDRPDFRGVVEEVLGRFSDVTFGYLDALPMADGYDFLLCTHCQAVRSTPFAIYRITPQTPAETFLTIGMSLALETQFTHRIPKILLTTNKHDIPSLLSGYEVVEARNDQECKTYLRKFMPDVIREVRKTTWRPRPLPFIEVVPKHVEKPAAENKPDTDAQSEVAEESVAAEQGEDSYIDKIGKYGLIRETGKGSFGTVYLARDTESNQTYAVKVMHPEHARDSSLTIRFEREASILMSLNDPHIVRGIDYGRDNDRHFMVMEYIDGQNLQYYIATGGPMEPLRALNYALQVAAGLDAAYKQGIVHRAVSPNTIKINSKDMVKIISFFLAQSQETRKAFATTEENTFVDAPYYTSPEQAENAYLVDTRSDLYSLAVVSFEMLAGRPPFAGGDINEVLLKHKQERVPSIIRLCPDLPVDMDAFFQKAMAKSPADRFQMPREFIAALDQLQQRIQAMPLGGQAADSGSELDAGSAGGTPSLEISSNINPEKHTYKLDRQVISIGRDPSNDIVINEPVVSGFHAQIVRDGNQFILVHPHPKRQSTANGLLYQGRQIPGNEQFRKPLAHRDIFRIGDEHGTLVTLTYNDGNDKLNTLVGKTLSAFRIVERIGAGGMATVFKAYQPRLDRYVAVKVLPAYHARDPIFVKRFAQEARSVAKLAHPNIVQIHDFGEQDNILYIVMEYVEGGTLKDRLRQRALTVPETVDLMIQAAEGLNCAHRNGIVHRDVKPANMLLRKDGHLLISDFGIAKIFEETSIGIGTPQYMSPEQGIGQQLIDRRSDIYSLGIVLFHCMTGKVPFTGDSPVSITVKHLNEPLPVQQLQMAGVPSPIEQIVVKMTAKSPHDRYSSAQEVIDALRNALAVSNLATERRRSDMPSPIITEEQPTIKEQTCSNCGTINPAQAKFCRNCGKALLFESARLIIRLPQGGQQVYQIEKPVVNIGRQLSNDIIIEDKRVSNYHAQIKYQPNGEFIIFDLGSTNGITVNGTPNLRRHTLRNGDYFTIGNYDFHFERR